MWRGNSHGLSGIFTPQKDGVEEDLFDLHQGSTEGLGKVTGLDEFFSDLKASHEKRISMGIPPLNYLAFSYESFGHGKIEQIIKLIQKGREIGYETRGWCNGESAHLVICFATDDLTEDSGWHIYSWANIENNAESDSYGHASWYEFCYFGIPIHEDWDLSERNNRLIAESPDKRYLAYFGL